MAIIKAGKTGKSLGGVIGYATKTAKGEKIIGGVDLMNPENALEEMNMVKNMWRKEDGIPYKHFIQSFNPKDFESGKLTYEKAHELAYEFLEHDKFKGFQVLVVTHTDTKNPHNHLIINSVNMETGYKWQHSHQELRELKEFSNEISKKHELIVPVKNAEKGQVRAWDKDKWEMLKKHSLGEGKSYLADLAITVNQTTKTSLNEDEFLKNMKEKGYELSRNTKSSYTFLIPNTKDKNGNLRKVRTSNLEKTFSDEDLGKEGILKNIEKNKEKLKVLETETKKLEKVRGDDFKNDFKQGKITEKEGELNEPDIRRYGESEPVKGLERNGENSKSRTNERNIGKSRGYDKEDIRVDIEHGNLDRQTEYFGKSDESKDRYNDRNNEGFKQDVKGISERSRTINNENDKGIGRNNTEEREGEIGSSEGIDKGYSEDRKAELEGQSKGIHTSNPNNTNTNISNFGKYEPIGNLEKYRGESGTIQFHKYYCEEHTELQSLIIKNPDIARKLDKEIEKHYEPNNKMPNYNDIKFKIILKDEELKECIYPPRTPVNQVGMDILKGMEDGFKREEFENKKAENLTRKIAKMSNSSKTKGRERDDGGYEF